MKKLRIMLLSLVVLAAVGGALAFKAKFDTQYCTTLPIEVAGQLTCPADIGICKTTLSTTTTDVNFNKFCTTITNGNPAAPCAGRSCPNLSRLKNDE